MFSSTYLPYHLLPTACFQLTSHYQGRRKELLQQQFVRKYRFPTPGCNHENTQNPVLSKYSLFLSRNIGSSFLSKHLVISSKSCNSHLPSQPQACSLPEADDQRFTPSWGQDFKNLFDTGSVNWVVNLAHIKKNTPKNKTVGGKKKSSLLRVPFLKPS